MKKVICLLMALFLVFTLTACFSDAPSKEAFNEGTENHTSSNKKEETFGLNETAVFDTLKITATEIKETTGSTFFTPEEGKIFVGIKFIVENISDEDQAISSLLLFDAYADDVKCDLSISAGASFSEGTIDGEIAPGKKLIGWYPLEVTKDWKTLELNVVADIFSSASAKFVFNK